MVKCIGGFETKVSLPVTGTHCSESERKVSTQSRTECSKVALLQESRSDKAALPNASAGGGALRNWEVNQLGCYQLKSV